MALIKQIKVGGETYNIGVNTENPLIVSGDTLRLSIGSGLRTDVDGSLEVLVHSGLTVADGRVSLLVSGYDENFARGLAFERGMLKLKLGSGLKFNAKGEIDLA